MQIGQKGSIPVRLGEQTATRMHSPKGSIPVRLGEQTATRMHAPKGKQMLWLVLSSLD